MAMRSSLHVRSKRNGVERAMNTQRVRPGLLSKCGLLMAKFVRGGRSYILDDEAEREWSELACTEAVAERSAGQNRQLPLRVGDRNRAVS